MNFENFLKTVVSHLKKRNIQFALAGGLAASLYRQQIRTTNDIDFLFYTDSENQKQAEQIIKDLKLKPHIIRQAQLEGGPLFAIKRKTTKPFIVAGRKENKPTEIGLDFLLPRFPWFQKALERAQSNLVDFGFGKIPCLTAEDVILSKLFSLKNNAQRFQDLDDLKSIFEAKRDLNLSYLSGEMKALKLPLPKEIQNLAPTTLLKTTKNI